MKHFKTFESFVNEKSEYTNEIADITLTEEELNEGTAWFPGETIDDRIGDDSSEWNKFWKNAKKGDTFKSEADGVDLYTCKPGDVGKAKIKPSMMSIGHNYSRTGDEPGEDCLIIDRKPCQWIDSDYDEDDKIDTIFYTMKGENGKVFMLGEL
jgi:hypothetical protein